MLRAPCAARTAQETVAADPLVRRRGLTRAPCHALVVVQLPPAGHPRTAALVVELVGTSHRTDLVHEPRLHAAAGVEQYRAVDLPAHGVVVRTRPGAAGGDVQRLPWSAPLQALGVPVDLAALLG